jgi:hypothetical protein
MAHQHREAGPAKLRTALGFDDLQLRNRVGSTSCVILSLILFGIAFGYVEGAVVVYLRAIGEPIRTAAGLSTDLFPLLKMGQLGVHLPYVRIEVVREAATIVMLATAAAAATRTFPAWLAAFSIAFGAWDLSFYATLRVLTGWPASLITWGPAVPDPGTLGGPGAGAVDRVGNAGGRRHRRVGARAAAGGLDRVELTGRRRSRDFRLVRMGLALHRGWRLSSLVPMAAVLGRRVGRNGGSGSGAVDGKSSGGMIEDDPLRPRRIPASVGNVLFSTYSVSMRYGLLIERC